MHFQVRVEIRRKQQAPEHFPASGNSSYASMIPYLPLDIGADFLVNFLSDNR